MVRRRENSGVVKDHRVFTYKLFRIKVFEENIKVGKYVLNILKTMQFCNCEI